MRSSLCQLSLILRQDSDIANIEIYYEKSPSSGYFFCYPRILFLTAASTADWSSSLLDSSSTLARTGAMNEII